ncbi:MAG: IS1595 family transposase [Proteobacteria bacterium]|nr:IS1595 family transposase [Pseudomonadota bacterium]
MQSALSADHFHNEEAAYAFVEARLWPQGPVCPHCGATDEHVGRLKGKTTRVGLCKCYACRKPFTVKMGTVMESSHVPLRIWLQAIYLICSSKKGISTRQLQRTFGCGLKTAWFLSHRVREAMADLGMAGSEPMGGAGKVVEADETYVGGKEKNKHRSKRNKTHIGGVGKQMVFSLVERGGKVRSQHLQSISANNLRPILKQHIHAATAFMTDGEGQYRLVGPMFARHEVVNHGIGEYVRGDAHTNTIEGYFSILKRGIAGVYHHISQEHLKRYLAEFDFRYNERAKLGVDDHMRADRALQGVIGKRLTYATPRSGKSRQPSLT